MSVETQFNQVLDEIGKQRFDVALVKVESLIRARPNFHLAHLVKGRVTRYEVPGVHAFNFVCEQALDGGGMRSMRNDPLGKGMAQILLSMPVHIPVTLLALCSAP